MLSVGNRLTSSGVLLFSAGSTEQGKRNYDVFKELLVCCRLE